MACFVEPTKYGVEFEGFVIDLSIIGNWLMRGWIVKKILGVVGSPCRNVNTHILVSRILEGAKKEGAALEVIFAQ